MFKRLFIGLLILSALTADGTGILPGNIYRTFFKLGSTLNPAEEKPPMDIGVLKGKVSDAFSLNASIGSSFFLLSRESAKKFIYSQVFLDIREDLNHSCLSISKADVRLLHPVLPKDRSILAKADISPPKT